MTESGLPGMTVVTYYGFLGPASMPADAVNRLNSAVNKSLNSSDVTATMVKAGFQPSGGSSQAFATLLASELQRWASVVKTTGFQME